jgi:ferredoxin-thioredoxin reductase catalytic subunit
MSTTNPINKNQDNTGDTPEELMKKYEEYAKNNGFKLNSDKRIVERIISGLLKNKEKYGETYCPCRRVSGNGEEDLKKICPCFWHKDEIKKDGHCFCNLYIK